MYSNFSHDEQPAKLSTGRSAPSIYQRAMQLCASADTEAQQRKATQWLLAAAEAGHAEAQFDLGLAYLEGHGVDACPLSGAYWLCRAARQGMARAQYWLAKAYFFGEGLEQDYLEAYRWCLAASDQGMADSSEMTAAAGRHLSRAQRERVRRSVTQQTRAANRTR